MKRRIIILCTALFFFLLQNTKAQSDTTTLKLKFKLSVNYNTRLNYYGRTDSLKSSGVFPLTELWLTSKVYINAAPIFVTNKLKRFTYAGTVATIGYQNIGVKWISGVYVTKPFYKKSSELVQSALKAQGGVSLAYQNKILNINTGGDIKFSGNVDYGATVGLDHIIRIENINGGVLIFDPAVYAYASTQNFQRTYYKKSNAAFLFFPAREQQVTEEINRFKVLAYEASMPIIYAKRKLMLIATPAYILPQNLIMVSSNPGWSEHGENTFYATLTAKYTF